jgi:hypothetical protein
LTNCESEIMKQLLIALATSVLIGSAIEARQGPKMYVSLGTGVGGAGSETGLAYGCTTSLLVGRIIVSVRGIGCKRLLMIFGPEFSSADYSVLAGIGTWDTTDQVSVEVGVGYVRISDEGKLLITNGGFGPTYEQVRQSAVGISWQGQFYHRGAGLVIYGDVNKVRSFAGVMFCLRFGKW